MRDIAGLWYESSLLTLHRKARQVGTIMFGEIMEMRRTQNRLYSMTRQPNRNSFPRWVKCMEMIAFCDLIVVYEYCCNKDENPRISDPRSRERLTDDDPRELTSSTFERQGPSLPSLMESGAFFFLDVFCSFQRSRHMYRPLLNLVIFST